MRQSGAEIGKETQKKHSVIDARMRNWGMVFRGGYPRPSLSSGRQEDKKTLDELDAEVIERAMVELRARCKNSRRGRHYKRLYSLARLMYLGDKPMVILTQRFRTDEIGIQRLHGRLLDIVSTFLEVDNVRYE